MATSGWTRTYRLGYRRLEGSLRDPLGLPPRRLGLRSRALSRASPATGSSEPRTTCLQYRRRPGRAQRSRNPVQRKGRGSRQRRRPLRGRRVRGRMPDYSSRSFKGRSPSPGRLRPSSVAFRSWNLENPEAQPGQRWGALLPPRLCSCSCPRLQSSGKRSASADLRCC